MDYLLHRFTRAFFFFFESLTGSNTAEVRVKRHPADHICLKSIELFRTIKSFMRIPTGAGIWNRVSFVIIGRGGGGRTHPPERLLLLTQRLPYRLSKRVDGMMVKVQSTRRSVPAADRDARGGGGGGS